MEIAWLWREGYECLDKYPSRQQGNMAGSAMDGWMKAGPDRSAAGQAARSDLVGFEGVSFVS